MKKLAGSPLDGGSSQPEPRRPFFCPLPWHNKSRPTAWLLISILGKRKNIFEMKGNLEEI